MKNDHSSRFVTPVAAAFLVVTASALGACTKETTSGASGTSGAAASSGASGSTSGDGECPKDISASSVGKSCSAEGKICGGSATAVRMLQCSRGKWVELNAPPPPPPASH